METLPINTKKKYIITFKQSSVSHRCTAEGESVNYNDGDFIRIGDSHFAKSEIVAIEPLEPESTSESTPEELVKEMFGDKVTPVDMDTYIPDDNVPDVMEDVSRGNITGENNDLQSTGSR